MTHAEEQLLVCVFRLGDAYFGIPADQIEEVVQVGTFTSVHHAPPFVCGIRNLRGRIVTIIDLKQKLGLGEAESGFNTRIMMVDSEGELVGLLVEAVEDMIFLDPAAVASTQAEVKGINPEVLRGIYQFGNRLLVLLDHEPILKSKSKQAKPVLVQ
jgi:purine-binding chemotaxis protein CheW